MNNDGFNIEEVLDDLSDKRPIFTSEADFQLALAQSIVDKYSNAKVRLEYVPSFNPSMHIDILVFWKNGKRVEWIPIEVKYKTKDCSYTDDDGCLYNLKYHDARDEGCYGLFQDIERIERFVGNDQFKEGYAIFLTNDDYYVNGVVKEDSKHYAFRLSDGKDKSRSVNSGKYEWRNDKGSFKKKVEPITLNREYKFYWKDYSTVNKSTFNVLL